jgi:two-component system heavy metal sensor histidine kinase CusS
MPFDAKSLTLRLTLLFAVTSTIVLIAIGYVFYVSLGTHFLHEDALELHGKIELLENLAGKLQSDEDLKSFPDKLRDALVGHENLFLRLRSPDERFTFASAATAPFLHAHDAPAMTERDVDGMAIDTVEAGGHRYRSTRFQLSTRFPQMPRLDGELVMNVDHHQQFMARVRDSTAVSLLLGAMASVFLGWIAARIGMAPVRAFSVLSSRISAKRLSERIDVNRMPTELAQLGESFNAMLARLEDSFRRLNEFSSDLAHELRTPISALMTQSQVALSRSRSADEYREVIYSAMEEYDRLARMITDMLFLAQADHGLLVPNRESVNLRGEILALYDFYDALVESKGVTLAIVGAGVVRGDRIMIRRALSNLLSNAIRHATLGTAVTTAIESGDDGAVTLTITNEGREIPPEHLPKLFERFYRVDSARERSSDGAGLGLSITKTIVSAHAGTISVSSESGNTRFKIHFSGG